MKKPINKFFKKDILLIFILIMIILCYFLIPNKIIGKELFISILIYFFIQLLRDSSLFDYFGIPQVEINDELFTSEKKILFFIVRKSVCFVIPFVYVLINPNLSFGDLGLLKFNSKLWIQLILIIFLIFFTYTFFQEAKKREMNFLEFAKAFFLSFISAGFPEDVLIIGYIGTRMILLFNNYVNQAYAFLFSFFVINLLFSLSHLPNLQKSKKIYSEHMTGKQNTNFFKMLIQIFLFGFPNWLFYFLSGHIWFSIWIHTIVDITPFFKKINKN